MRGAKWSIQTGIIGAIIPAVVFVCLGSLGGGLLYGLFVSLLILVTFSAIWGSTAGILTDRIWGRGSRPIAFLIGAIGTCSGLLTLYVMLMELRPWSRSDVTGRGWAILLGVTIIIAGILAQIVTVYILVGLRKLTGSQAR
jgi:hypothetical protein